MDLLIAPHSILSHQLNRLTHIPIHNPIVAFCKSGILTSRCSSVDLASALADTLSTHNDSSQQPPTAPPRVEWIYLPDLPCSFPVKRHPDYERISEEVYSWLFTWIYPRTQCEREMLLQSDFAGNICSEFPESPHPERLLLLSKFLAWVCCFDDISDQSDKQGADPKMLSIFIQSIQRVLDGDELLQVAGHPDMNAVFELLREFRRDMSPQLYRRHVESFMQVLHQVEEQAEHREESKPKFSPPPDLSTYITARRNTISLPHTLVMLEYCMGIDLDDETLNLESLKELHDSTADLFAWWNDLMSFRREYFDGDFQNLPSAVYFEGGGKLGFQEAIAKVCDMMRVRERDFIRLVHDVSLCDMASRKAEFRTYMHAFPYLLSGHHEWCYITARFHGANHRVKELRHGLLRMDPERTVLEPVSELFMLVANGGL